MNQLGGALRAWRERLAPDDVGLPQGLRRRAPGLRRSELAQLAGISVDYLIRLEQGRAKAPSASIVAALARALRLDEAERARLHELAGLAMPGPARMPTHIPPGVQRLLDQLTATPVGVHSAAYDVLAWNPLWAALLGEPSLPQNVAVGHFLGAGSRVRYTAQQETEFAAAIVADLQAALTRYPDDPHVARVVSRLRHESPRFAALWGTHAVPRDSLRTKVIVHPQVGELTLDCDTLTSAGSELRIVMYSAAPGSPAAERLRLLAVLGTQTLLADPVEAG